MNLKDYQERKTNPCHRRQRFQRFPEFFRFKIMEEKGKLVALLFLGLLCDSQSVRVFHKDRGESTLHHDVLSSLGKAIGAQLLIIHVLQFTLILFAKCLKRNVDHRVECCYDEKYSNFCSPSKLCVIIKTFSPCDWEWVLTHCHHYFSSYLIQISFIGYYYSKAQCFGGQQGCDSKKRFQCNLDSALPGRLHLLQPQTPEKSKD